MIAKISYPDGVQQTVECSSTSAARKIAADNMHVVYGDFHEWPDAAVEEIQECRWIDRRTGFHRNNTPVEPDGSCCSCGMI